MSDWWNTRTGWGNWFQVSGGVASAGSAVTAIARYSHHLDLFVISTDTRIYSTWWREGQSWAAWFNVSGGVGKPGGQVAAISRVTETSICSPSPATAWSTALGGTVRSVGRVGFNWRYLTADCTVPNRAPAAVSTAVAQ